VGVKSRIFFARYYEVCEEFLGRFFDENPALYDTLRLVIFEADYPEKCDYAKIRCTLREKGFEERVGGFQNVWVHAGR
jgi:hypothetical protein